MLLKGDDNPWSCGPRRSGNSCPYRRRVEGDDSLCESRHDSPQVQDSNAKQSLKELHALGKRHALARPCRCPILEKEAADQAGIWLFIDDIWSLQMGYPSPTTIPMRNAVRAEIAGMSSSRHQRDSYPILTVQVYTELYLNRKAKLSTGWGDWCACPKWWPYHLRIAFNLHEMDIIITTFSSSCLPFPPGDMVIYIAKGQAMAWR